MKLKRLEITDNSGKVVAFIELELKKENNQLFLTVNVNNKKATTTEIDRFLSLLDGVFFGLIKDNEIIETPEGYIVFFRGKDRYGLRVGIKNEREAIFLRRLAYREIYYWLKMQLIAEV